MAYYTPAQEWIRNLWSNNSAQNGFPGEPQMLPPLAGGNNMPAPGMQESMPQEEAPIESPISKGLEAGMSAGMRSRDINQEQKDRLAGLMLFHMFSGLGKGGGKENKSVLGGLSQGLTEGMPHLQNERLNMEKLNQMEMERQEAIQKEMQRRKEHQETRNDLNSYRNSTLQLARQKLNLEHGDLQNPLGSKSVEGVDVSGLPRLDKSSKTQYLKDYKNSGRVVHEVSGILKDLEKLKNLEKFGAKSGSPIISQADPYFSKIANPVKDFVGRKFSGDTAKQLNKEMLARQEFNTKLQLFKINAEKNLKGGVLGPGILDRFEKMKVFPDVSSGYDTTETLLNGIKKDAENIHKAHGIGLKSGYAVTPAELQGTNSLNTVEGISDEEMSKYKSMGYTPEEIAKIAAE